MRSMLQPASVASRRADITAGPAIDFSHLPIKHVWRLATLNLIMETGKIDKKTGPTRPRFFER
jgi:hypothetical protein